MPNVAFHHRFGHGGQFNDIPSVFAKYHEQRYHECLAHLAPAAPQEVLRAPTVVCQAAVAVQRRLPQELTGQLLRINKFLAKTGYQLCPEVQQLTAGSTGDWYMSSGARLSQYHVRFWVESLDRRN